MIIRLVRKEGYTGGHKKKPKAYVIWCCFEGEGSGERKPLLLLELLYGNNHGETETVSQVITNRQSLDLESQNT